MLDDKRVSPSLAHGLFVGRQHEVETLPSALEAALAGRGGLVILVGELTRQPLLPVPARALASSHRRGHGNSAAHLESHLGQLAYHFTEAAQGGGADKAISYAVRAGMRSMALLANEEAVGFYHMALEVWKFEILWTRCGAALPVAVDLRQGPTQDGEVPQALETLPCAAAIAFRLGLSEVSHVQQRTSKL